MGRNYDSDIGFARTPYARVVQLTVSGFMALDTAARDVLSFIQGQMTSGGLLVSGCGYTGYNGLWSEGPAVNGKPSYLKDGSGAVGTKVIFWDINHPFPGANRWRMTAYPVNVPPTGTEYVGIIGDNTPTPNGITWLPAPNVGYFPGIPPAPVSFLTGGIPGTAGVLYDFGAVTNASVDKVSCWASWATYAAATTPELNTGVLTLGYDSNVGMGISPFAARIQATDQTTDTDPGVALEQARSLALSTSPDAVIWKFLLAPDSPGGVFHAVALFAMSVNDLLTPP